MIDDPIAPFATQYKQNSRNKYNKNLDSWCKVQKGIKLDRILTDIGSFFIYYELTYFVIKLVSMYVNEFAI